MGEPSTTAENEHCQGNSSTNVSNLTCSDHENHNNLLKVMEVNIQGIECSGRLEQIRILLLKNSVSNAVLTETETSHSIAETTNIEGYKAYCPPITVTGPRGKEVGVTMMISNSLIEVFGVKYERTNLRQACFYINKASWQLFK